MIECLINFFLSSLLKNWFFFYYLRNKVYRMCHIIFRLGPLTTNKLDRTLWFIIYFFDAVELFFTSNSEQYTICILKAYTSLLRTFDQCSVHSIQSTIYIYIYNTYISNRYLISGIHHKC